jgi:dTDP-4-amino-4,6-dideoxygalactose transaminase
VLAVWSRSRDTLPSDGDATGRTFTADEAALVAMVLQRGTLNSTRGTMVSTFEQRFAGWLGSAHAIACASGSAAVHCAIAALRLQPGDEVVTTPITDMGALTPILYEGGVPVFADVDPITLNVTVDTVRAQLTDRTRAIIVTHLFGNPCDLDGLQALAAERGLVLVEDSAQAFGATWRNRKVGTFGKLGTFSLQQGKHITTGEGGIVVTDDADLARRVFLFVNKAWGYGDKKPDHYFPALNYRLTELQGAVAVAQLPKLDDVVAARRHVAATLQQALAGVEGLVLPRDPTHGTHSWWKFAFHLDRTLVPGGPRALATKLQAAGIACAPHYIQKPAFECELFRDWRASPVTWLPLQHNPRRERAAAMFDRARYQGALGGLDSVVVLPINERYTQRHCDHVAHAIRTAVAELRHG